MVGLVLLNAFFVAAEFSLVAVRRSRVEQLIAEGHRLARTVQRAVKNLDTYLAATQLGITMSSIGLGWIGEPILAALIAPVFQFLPGNWALIGSHALAVSIAFVIITTLHIVLGELAPKSLALQRTEGTALAVAKPLELFLTLFRPAIYFLNSLGNLTLRLFGLQAAGGEERLVHSLEELQLLVRAGRKAGLLEESEEDMVERVFRLDDRQVSALMTPRVKIVWLDLDDPPKEIRRKITDRVHSHFPVCQGSLDNVLGVVEAKELLTRSLAGLPIDLKASLQHPLFVPESISALKLLEMLKESRAHIALVVDEYGGLQGLITLNDVLEAIVGELPSAGELAQPQSLQREDGSWLLDGALPVEEFKKILNVGKLPGEEQGHYETLAGFVMMKLGLPSAGDHFEWAGLRFEVADMDENRVDKVLVMSVRTHPARLANNAWQHMGRQG
ncbi:MAG: hemolysin family protein [Candidatus Bipolaricaulia bacterium]